MKSVTPSIDSVSFSCLHCGAHADQFWSDLYAKELENHGIPFRFDSFELEKLKNKANATKDSAIVERFRERAKRVESGELFFFDATTAGKSLYNYYDVENLAISRCYSCRKLSVWVDRVIVFPLVASEGAAPNEDLPFDVKRDFDEARAILGLSPRGAAALLRLCVQKICIFLGLPGENLNADVASLVEKGLDSRVQQALDIVRVIGNESIHPGNIDLRDDPATAARLFELVNLIAERMISEPKRVEEMFNALPSSKKQSIVDRDKPKV